MKTKIDVYDYLVLAVVLSISISIGLYQGFKPQISRIYKKFCKRNLVSSKSKSKSDSEFIELDNLKSNDEKVSDYLIASASMGAFPISLSLLASFYSATTLLGMPAEVYQYGIGYWIAVFGMIIPPFIGAFVTGPFFANLGIFSVFEYLELRFSSKKVRSVGMTLYVIRMFISSAIYLYGPATSLSILTSLNEKISIGLMGVIATFYTTIGGIKAVIWTDLFQALIMFSSLLLIFIKGMIDIGGFGNLIEINYEGDRLNLFNFNPDPFIRQSTWSLFFGMFVSSIISYAFDQQMIQRFKAAKTKKTAQIALLMNVPCIFLMVSLCCTIGLILYATYYKCDPLSSKRVNNPNQLVGYLVMDSLSMYPGAAGLFLSSLFCGSLSSVSSSMNSQAAIIWEDFFKQFSYFKKLNDTKKVTINKIIVLSCGVISTGLAYFVSTLGGNLIQISASLNGALYAPLIGLFLLAFLFKLSNDIGAIIGTILSLLLCLWISIGAIVVQPIYPKLSVSTEYCNISSLNIDNLLKESTSSDLGFNKVYYLSYMWYSVLGTLGTLIFGLIISVLTCGHKNKVDNSLIIVNLLGFLPINK